MNIIVEFSGVNFNANIIPIQLGGVDVILWIDWLSMYEAEIVCVKKMAHVRSLECKPFIIQKEKSHELSDHQGVDFVSKIELK